MGKRRTQGEGSLFQRQDGLWVGRVTMPDGKRAQVTAKTQKEASKRWEELKTAARDGMPIVSRQLSVKDILETWLESYIKIRRTPQTYRTYAGLSRNHLIPALGKIPLVRLRQDHVDHLLGRLAEDHSTRSVRLVHTTLRAALAYAVRRNLLGRNVASLVDLIPVKRAPVQPLSNDDVGRLLRVFNGHTLEPLFILAITTGMRQGEILGLRWSDVDLGRGSMRVWNQLQNHKLTELKTERSRRTVDLPGPAFEALREQRVKERFRGHGKDTDPVFTFRNGQPPSTTLVRRTFKRFLKAAGVDDHRFHDLRHTAVSLYLDQDTPLHEVSKIVGHASVQITADIYGHLSSERRREAADRMGAAFEKFAAS